MKRVGFPVQRNSVRITVYNKFMALKSRLAGIFGRGTGRPVLLTLRSRHFVALYGICTVIDSPFRSILVIGVVSRKHPFSVYVRHPCTGRSSRGVYWKRSRKPRRRSLAIRWFPSPDRIIDPSDCSSFPTRVYNPYGIRYLLTNRQLSVRPGRFWLDQLPVYRGEVRSADGQVDGRTGHEQQTEQLCRGYAGRHAVLRGRKRRDHVHVERWTVKRQAERLGANSHHAVPQVRTGERSRRTTHVCPVNDRWKTTGTSSPRRFAPNGNNRRQLYGCRSNSMVHRLCGDFNMKGMGGGALKLLTLYISGIFRFVSVFCCPFWKFVFNDKIVLALVCKA